MKNSYVAVVVFSALSFACGADPASVDEGDLGALDVVEDVVGTDSTSGDVAGDLVREVEDIVDSAPEDIDLIEATATVDAFDPDVEASVDNGEVVVDEVMVLDVVDDSTGDVGVEDTGPSVQADPDDRGPYQTLVNQDYVDRDDRRIPVESHIPQGAVGQKFPLVVFVPGFQMTCDQFSNHCDELASHGFVVICAEPDDPIIGMSHIDMALDVVAVVDYAMIGGMSVVVDADYVGTAGHSLGGKVAVMAAHRDSRVSAVFAIDPVNGGNPVTGYSDKLPDIVPGEVSGLDIALGFVGETTNGEGSFLSPACAPLDQNFQTFYDEASSATWKAQWEFTGADHMDFIDYEITCGAICDSCPDGTAQLRNVSRGTRTLLSAFFRRHFNKDISMDSWLTGADLPDGIVLN